MLYENIKLLADLTEPTALKLHKLEEKYAPDMPPNIFAMGDIGVTLSREISQISESQLRSVFDFAEQLMVSGDVEIRTAVSTGFLEALLGESSAQRLDFRQIGPMLGEECRKYCKAWDQFCGITTEGL